MCLRIGPRCHVSCSSLTLLNGSQSAFVDNIRCKARRTQWAESSATFHYVPWCLCFRYFSCCFDRAKRSFFRSCSILITVYAYVTFVNTSLIAFSANTVI